MGFSSSIDLALQKKGTRVMAVTLMNEWDNECGTDGADKDMRDRKRNEVASLFEAEGPKLKTAAEEPIEAAEEPKLKTAAEEPKLKTAAEEQTAAEEPLKTAAEETLKTAAEEATLKTAAEEAKPRKPTPKSRPLTEAQKAAHAELEAFLDAKAIEVDKRLEKDLEKEKTERANHALALAMSANEVEQTKTPWRTAQAEKEEKRREREERQKKKRKRSTKNNKS